MVLAVVGVVVAEVGVVVVEVVVVLDVQTICLMKGMVLIDVWERIIIIPPVVFFGTESLGEKWRMEIGPKVCRE